MYAHPTHQSPLQTSRSTQRCAHFLAGGGLGIFFFRSEESGGPVRSGSRFRSFCSFSRSHTDDRSQPVCQSHKNLPPANQENILSERASVRGRSGRASDEQRTHEGWVFDDGFERIPTHVRVAQDAAQRQCDERPRDVRVFLDVPPSRPGETLFSRFPARRSDGSRARRLARPNARLARAHADL